MGIAHTYLIILVAKKNFENLTGIGFDIPLGKMVVIEVDLKV